MLSFQEYASEKQIINLLIKERVKIAINSKLHNVHLQNINENGHLSIYEKVALLMPPRKSWKRPHRRERKKNNGTEEKSRKQVLTRSIALTIRHDRKNPENHPYLQRLDEYVHSLRQLILSDTPLSFKSIKIGNKTKKYSNGIKILRPLCIFESLTEKLLIALASKYLSQAFDPLLHEEILSYRPLRHYHNNTQPVITDRDNAIENLQQYRHRFRHKALYVAECDIQKYFDTINHDIIRKCFKDMAQRVKGINPEFDYDCVERILDAYLNSYSFYNDIDILNENMLKSKSPRMFEGPKRNLFIERGCYTEDELNNSLSKIGIPQGGALSGLISNVVLNYIDRKSILAEHDSQRYFCRYGDDIMLIHTSKEKCQELIDNYCKALTENKLLYHTFVSVGDKEFRYPDGTTRPCLWNQKSRSPYLWGRSDTDSESVDWVGFLGYEIRYTGEVRLRRSSLNDKFKNIKRKFRSGAKTLIAKGEKTFATQEDFENEVFNRFNRFKGDGLIGAKSLTYNKYSITQAIKLDKYLNHNMHRLLYKIARNNQCPKQALRLWWLKIKDKGYNNHLLTINHK